MTGGIDDPTLKPVTPTTNSSTNSSISSTNPTSGVPAATDTPKIVKDYYGNPVQPGQRYVSNVTRVVGPKGQGTREYLTYSTGETLGGSASGPLTVDQQKAQAEQQNIKDLGFTPGGVRNLSDIQKSIENLGITYQSQTPNLVNGINKSGGPSPRDLFVQNVENEAAQGFKQQGTKSITESIEKELGSIGLAYNPETKTITDPLLIKTISEQKENQTKGGYAGLSSGGPSTPQSKALGSSVGQRGQGYTQDTYSKEQIASIIKSNQENKEFGGNPSFLQGKTQSNKPSSSLSTADLSSLANEKTVNIGGHQVLESLLYTPSKEEVTKANVAREEQGIDKLQSEALANGLISLSNQQIQQKNQLLEQQNINNKINSGIDLLAQKNQEIKSVNRIGAGLEFVMPPGSSGNPVIIGGVKIVNPLLGTPLEILGEYAQNQLVSTYGLVKSIPERAVTVSKEIADILTHGISASNIPLTEQMYSPFGQKEANFVSKNTYEMGSLIGGAVGLVKGATQGKLDLAGFTSSRGLGVDLPAIALDIATVLIPFERVGKAFPVRIGSTIKYEGEGLIEAKGPLASSEPFIVGPKIIEIKSPITLGYEGKSAIGIGAKSSEGERISFISKLEPGKSFSVENFKPFSERNEEFMTMNQLTRAKFGNAETATTLDVLNKMKENEVNLLLEPSLVNKVAKGMTKLPNVAISETEFAGMSQKLSIPYAEPILEQIKIIQSKTSSNIMSSKVLSQPTSNSLLSPSPIIENNPLPHKVSLNILSSKTLSATSPSSVPKTPEDLVAHNQVFGINELKTGDKELSELYSSYAKQPFNTLKGSLGFVFQMTKFNEGLESAERIPVKSIEEIGDIDSELFGKTKTETAEAKQEAEQKEAQRLSDLLNLAVPTEEGTEFGLKGTNIVFGKMKNKEIQGEQIINLVGSKDEIKDTGYADAGKVAGQELHRKPHTIGGGLKVTPMSQESLAAMKGSISLATKETLANYEHAATPEQLELTYSRFKREGKPDVEIIVSDPFIRFKDTKKLYGTLLYGEKTLTGPLNKKYGKAMGQYAKNLKEVRTDVDFTKTEQEVETGEFIPESPYPSKSSSKSAYASSLKPSPISSTALQLHEGKSSSSSIVEKQTEDLVVSSKGSSIRSKNETQLLSPISAISILSKSSSKSGLKPYDELISSSLSKSSSSTATEEYLASTSIYSESKSTKSSESSKNTSVKSESVSSKYLSSNLSPSSESKTSPSPLSPSNLSKLSPSVLSILSPSGTNPTLSLDESLSLKNDLPHLEGFTIDIKTKTTEGIKPKPKPRADFIGNTSESQIEGIYNRQETVYGIKRTSKLAGIDYRQVNKGRDSLVSVENVKLLSKKRSNKIDTVKHSSKSDNVKSKKLNNIHKVKL